MFLFWFNGKNIALFVLQTNYIMNSDGNDERWKRILAICVPEINFLFLFSISIYSVCRLCMSIQTEQSPIVDDDAFSISAPQYATNFRLSSILYDEILYRNSIYFVFSLFFSSFFYLKININRFFAVVHWHSLNW